MIGEVYRRQVPGNLPNACVCVPTGMMCAVAQRRMGSPWQGWLAVGGAVAVVVILMVINVGKNDDAPASRSQADISAAQASDLLRTLPVKGRASKTGYSRTQFGEAWTDVVTVAGGHNGCDTRNDILQRDLTEVMLRRGSRCVVESGVLSDVYTGRTIRFARGAATSAAVQIDHMVALSDAWQTGAQQLSRTERTNLANDPLNLQAVDGPTNQSKSDGDAATWLPPSKAYRCTYVIRQVQVKSRYHLWVTRAEHDAIAKVLKTCV